MPAYHLIAANGGGITLVNIGVGPSNAKTICDHLAVLRPEVWLMIGHCGGLRPSQTIGDYVLAHAYLRDDHVLDSNLPVDFRSRRSPKSSRLSTTPPPRSPARSLRISSAVCAPAPCYHRRPQLGARDPEFGAPLQPVAGGRDRHGIGHRRRPGLPLPGALRHPALRSDKPLHGEIKLPGQANAFYERAISQHFRIGIETLRMFQRQGSDLHSRKLRSFDEPPFR